MPPNPAQKVPQVGHRDPPGPHSRDVNSCPRERQGGYKQIPPDLPGGYRPPGRLLLQLQRLSSVVGFRLTPKGRWCYVPSMYVYIFIKLHITAQSGLVILVILCHSRFIPAYPQGEVVLCMYVCMYIYEIAHNRAIRPCHPSHSMPLALILPSGDQ